MKKRKLRTLALIWLLCLSVGLTACTSASKADSNTQSDTLEGRITAVDSGTLTIAVSAAPPAGSAPTQPGAGGQPGGAAPDQTEETRTLNLTVDTEILLEEAGGTTTAGAASDLAVNDRVMVTADGDTALSVTKREGKEGNVPGAGNAPGGNTGDNGTAATLFEEDTSSSGGSYSSTQSDENAIRAESGAQVTLTQVTVAKTGKTSDTDTSNFYGQNAAVLAQDGAALQLDGAKITTDASGANGVFAYGTGTVNATNSTIKTEKDNSGGIEVAGGGTLNATSLTVETKGQSAAAIRSDRGGGTETVDGGSYTTNGTGSPAVYSTADVTVRNAVLTANHSEAVVVEGKNSVALTNCTVTGSMDGTYGTDGENIHGVMLYQSMSGDAEEGEASFSMDGGSLTAQKGDLFYVTNTSCTITLHAASLSYDTTCRLLQVCGNDSANGWGTQGANGGRVTMNCTGQTLAGDIDVDEISTLALTLSEQSTLTGSVNSSNSGAEKVAVTLDATSRWTLTDDCYLTEFTGSTSCIAANGHHVYVNGTVLV